MHGAKPVNKRPESNRIDFPSRPVAGNLRRGPQSGNSAPRRIHEVHRRVTLREDQATPIHPQGFLFDVVPVAMLTSLDDYIRLEPLKKLFEAGLDQVNLVDEIEMLQRHHALSIGIDPLRSRDSYTQYADNQPVSSLARKSKKPHMSRVKHIEVP
jgi:hypothetical protein